jgi:prepilin-type N-terminal cleavage/methylation domain-containing protein
MTKRNHAFTLIEIMIVIIMLAILAAMIVPRIVDAQGDARESALETDIQMMRRQILVYKVQHGGNGPHLDAEGNLDKANFPARLTGRTSPDGKLTSNGSCGPYMAKWPTNPFIQSAETAGGVIFGTDTTPPRNSTSGWYYNTDTCVISVNSATGGEKLDPNLDVAETKGEGSGKPIVSPSDGKGKGKNAL